MSIDDLKFINWTNGFKSLDNVERDIFKKLNYIVYGKSVYIQYVSNVNVKDNKNKKINSGRNQLIETISNLQTEIRCLIDNKNHQFIKIDDILNEIRFSCICIIKNDRKSALRPDELIEKIEILKYLVYSYQNRIKRTLNFLKNNIKIIYLSLIVLLILSPVFNINILLVLVLTLFSILLENNIIDNYIDNLINLDCDCDITSL